MAQLHVQRMIKADQVSSIRVLQKILQYGDNLSDVILTRRENIQLGAISDLTGSIKTSGSHDYSSLFSLSHCHQVKLFHY